MIPIAKPIIDNREKELVMEVLDSGILSIGKVVSDFEDRFAAYTGSKFAIATSSGTTALHLALAASGIKKGDKVLTSPFSFIATSNSVLYCGAEPVFCDIEDRTFNMDPVKIRETLEKDREIKALLIVHLYGHPCNMDEIMKIVNEYNLILIEDCAQAHGCRYKGKHVGTFGDAGIFSFYPTKNMTTAEGGMVITDSEEFYNQTRLLREHGMPKTGQYDFYLLGFNFRMTNIEAAIGIGQLEKLDSFNKRRKENGEYYNENLKNLDWLKIPVVEDNCEHCYHQYTLRVRDRERFTDHLKVNGIGFKVYYPAAIPDSVLYRDLGFSGEAFPVTRKMAEEVVSIPVHPAVSPSDVEKVAEVIKSFKPSSVEV